MLFVAWTLLGDGRGRLHAAGESPPVRGFERAAVVVSLREERSLQLGVWECNCTAAHHELLCFISNDIAALAYAGQLAQPAAWRSENIGLELLSGLPTW